MNYFLDIYVQIPILEYLCQDISAQRKSKCKYRLVRLKTNASYKTIGFVVISMCTHVEVYSHDTHYWKNSHDKSNREKKEVYPVLYIYCSTKHITFQWLSTTKIMGNNFTLLHLAHTTTYIQTDEKWPQFPSVLYIHTITYLPYAHTFHKNLYDPTYKDILLPTSNLWKKRL